MIIKPIKSRHAGQILIVWLLVLGALVPLCFETFAIGKKYIAKMQQQKTVDVAVMNIVREKTRALNAVAAYNAGLEIVAERAYEVALISMGIAACAAMSTIFSPAAICVSQWARISPKLPEFFRRIQKLADHMAKAQDQILSSMRKNQDVLLTFDPKDPLGSIKEANFFSVISNGEELSMKRANWSNSKKSGQLAGGGDLIKCEARQLNRWDEVETLKTNSQMNPPSYLLIYYENTSTGLLKTKKFSNTAELLKASNALFENNEAYNFVKADLNICKSFEGLLSSLSGGAYSMFNLPAPLEFTEKFFSGGNQYVLIRSKSVEEHDFNFHKDLAQKTQVIWSVASAEIAGSNPREMKFKTKLVKTPPLNRVWQKFSQQSRIKKLTDIFGFPTLKEFQRDLQH